MGLTRLDHYSIRTDDLETTRDFYVDALGLVDGARPPFPFPGFWLYCGDRPVVHLIGLDPEGAQGLSDYMGEDRKQALKGGGAVDHVAFNGDDLDGMRRRLDGLGIAYRERDVPDMDLHQVFVQDPNGFTIEINFWAN